MNRDRFDRCRRQCRTVPIENDVGVGDDVDAHPTRRRRHDRVLSREEIGRVSLHKWTVYVRGANGEDLSHCVAAVEFTLHPSFEESTRRLTKAPFEVTETGWGEFDIGVKMEFVDGGAATTTTPLKLFPTREEIAKYGPQTTKKPLIKERYEEIVIHECDAAFSRRMKAQGGKRAPKSEHDDAWSTFTDRRELVSIYAAREVTAERIKVLEQQLEVLESIDANA